MDEVANSCAKCGTTTAGGQFYRFYFGIVEDLPEEGPIFRRNGSEQVYYCDRCILRSAVREQLARTVLFSALAMFGMIVVGFLVLTSSRGLWLALAALIGIVALGGTAYRGLRRLRATLRSPTPDQLRQEVCSNQKLQDMGDVWAIAARRPELPQARAELFLTRSENEAWEHL